MRRRTSELCYHVGDYDRFLTRFDIALADTARAPIGIGCFDVPDSQYHDSIVGDFDD